MKVIVINDAPGFCSGDVPPFKVGDILTVEQSPYDVRDYRVVGIADYRGWDKRRFVPLDNIDETEFVNIQQNDLCLTQ